MTRKPLREVVPALLQVPVRECNKTQSIELGFRTNHVTCEHGGVLTGAGCGSPWIIVEWRGRTWAVHAVELLASVLAANGYQDDADVAKDSV
jgi:hypothetical protein